MKSIINTTNAPAAVGAYSQAVEINGVLYISGQVPLDPVNGKMINGGIREQTVQVMKNIGAILEAAGYNYSHVVKSTVLLSDIDQFQRHERCLWIVLSPGSTGKGCLCSERPSSWSPCRD